MSESDFAVPHLQVSVTGFGLGSPLFLPAHDVELLCRTHRTATGAF